MTTASHPAPPSALAVVLGVIAVVAVAVPGWLALHPPRVVTHLRRTPARVVPQNEVPAVEPVAFEELAPDDARDYNASVPFVAGPNPPARPFRFGGDTDQRARARDCLATAVLYEAGDDTQGERAVAQVVLNRARHPAFPKTVCGVVFQGAERSTGCQFTFTCDGALANHRFSDAAWTRAQQVATAALSGTVYKPVGYATHYHTDWVVPYWQSSLDKLAAVHTHLFFRWTGWWGTPAAFNRIVSSDEPVIPALAALSDAHRTATAYADADAAIAAGAAVTGNATGIAHGDPNTFVLRLDPHLLAEDFPAMAMRACGERPYCKVMAWSDPADMPTLLPASPAQMTAMSFSYLRDREHDFDKALWNCKEFKRGNSTQCMKQQLLVAPVVGPTAEAGDAKVKPALVAAKPVPNKMTPLPVALPTPAQR